MMGVKDSVASARLHSMDGTCISVEWVSAGQRCGEASCSEHEMPEISCPEPSSVLRQTTLTPSWRGRANRTKGMRPHGLKDFNHVKQLCRL